MEFITVKEAAAALGVSQQSVRAWTANKKIAHQRVGTKIRILASEVQRFLAVIPASKSL